jgi:hypothetical protein
VAEGDSDVGLQNAFSPDLVGLSLKNRTLQQGIELDPIHYDRFAYAC